MSDKIEKNRLAEVDSLIEKYPDVPQEAIFKEDLLLIHS